MIGMDRLNRVGNIQRDERSLVIAIRLDDLPHEVADALAMIHDRPPQLDDGLASIERAHVVEILRRERGNKSCAARALGVNRRSLYRLLEKYNIDPSNPT